MTTFDTACTHPQTTVNFVSGPDARGTFDILWQCLSISLLCTYTSLHLNVPPQELPDGWPRKRKRFLNKIRWMIFAILAPEYIPGKAYSDRVSAYKHLKEYEKVAKDDRVEPWPISHIFLANMGGFTITSNPEQLGELDDDAAARQEDPSQRPGSLSEAIEGACPVNQSREPHSTHPLTTNRPSEACLCQRQEGDDNLLAYSRAPDVSELRTLSPAGATPESNVVESDGNLLDHSVASDTIEMDTISPERPAPEQPARIPPEESHEAPRRQNSTTINRPSAS